METVAAAWATAQPYLSTISTAASVLGAFSSVGEGYQKQQMYRLQAEQTRLESERRALQYEQQGVSTLRRINSVTSAAAARAYAGGVAGFEGSAGLVQKASEALGGKELQIAQENIAATRRGGLIQANIYDVAGETAARGGWFDAAAKLGTAALRAGSIGGPQYSYKLPTYPGAEY